MQFNVTFCYYLPSSFYKKSRLLKITNTRGKTFQKGFPVFSMLYSDLKTAAPLKNFILSSNMQCF